MSDLSAFRESRPFRVLLHFHAVVRSAVLPRRAISHREWVGGLGGASSPGAAMGDTEVRRSMGEQILG